jgi:putative membrane protein
VIELIVRILINAAALFVAVKVLPKYLSFNWGADWWKLLVVALIFALVNSYIKPIVKALSLFPISMMTLGLVAFVINAVMLLLVAFLSGQLKLGFKVGDFPPSVTLDTIVGAIVGALIISVVSTLASIALSPRKLI